jgi:hypothetical protein
VGFVVDKVALRQIFAEYFGFPRPILIPSGTGTIDQLVADVPSGLSPHPMKLKKNTSTFRREVVEKSGAYTSPPPKSCVHFEII